MSNQQNDSLAEYVHENIHFCDLCHEQTLKPGRCIKCTKDPIRSVILSYGSEEEKNQQRLKDEWTPIDEQEYIRSHFD
jgi:hypothetical protein